MKKIILILALIVSTASFAQPNKAYYFEISTSAFITNYCETGINVDAGIFTLYAKWYPSFNIDIYTAAKPIDNCWTTVDYGILINVPILKSLILSAGPKYVTQGPEHIDGYSQFIFNGSAAYTIKLIERTDGIMWLRLAGQYTTTPQQRVYGLVGLQFVLR